MNGFKKKDIYFPPNQLKSLVNSDSSCVNVYKNYRGTLSLLPFHLGFLRQAAEEQLKAKVAKYDVELDGIVMGFSNVKMINSAILDDVAPICIDYFADVYLFKPTPGNKLTGIVNKKSNEHFGCLIHGVFNATIVKSAIPSDRVKGKSRIKVNNDFWLEAISNIPIESTMHFIVRHVDLAGRLPSIVGSLPESQKINCQPMEETESESITDQTGGEENNLEQVTLNNPDAIAKLFSKAANKKVKLEKTNGNHQSDELSEGSSGKIKRKKRIRADDSYVNESCVEESVETICREKKRRKLIHVTGSIAHLHVKSKEEGDCNPDFNVVKIKSEITVKDEHDNAIQLEKSKSKNVHISVNKIKSEPLME